MPARRSATRSGPRAGAGREIYGVDRKKADEAGLPPPLGETISWAPSNCPADTKMAVHDHKTLRPPVPDASCWTKRNGFSKTTFRFWHRPRRTGFGCEVADRAFGCFQVK